MHLPESRRLGPHWFRWREGDLLLDVVVQPGAKRNEIAGLHGAALKLRIQAPPVDGKANRAIVEFFAELFAVARAQVDIVRGDTARTKTVRIRTPAALPSTLRELGLCDA